VPDLHEALVQGLADRGYVDGRTISLVWRDAGGDVGRLPATVRELIALDVDLLIVAASPTVRAAKEATKTIPIVMAASTDALANGLVASLGRPGGNVTGLTLDTPELTAKRLQLLKAIVPSLGRVGFIVDQTSVAAPNMTQRAQQAAQELSLALDVAWVHTSEDLDRAVGHLARERMQGLLIQLSPLTVAMRGRISELANKEQLPAIGETREFAAAGLLAGYGPRLSDSYRRAGYFVDKILKGAKPADLPVEQPTRVELVVNLKTAKALGLTIPKELLLRADEVIQ
jgi:putative ABC transport system substrate-binding protein